MQPNPIFLQQTPEFWAYVKTISQSIGYTTRGSKKKNTESSPKIPTIKEIKDFFKEQNFSTSAIFNDQGQWTNFGDTLNAYFIHRADSLDKIKSLLMTKEQAEIEFNKIKDSYTQKCPLPMNKQKGDKKNYAFLTGLVNMLIEKSIDGSKCDYNPMALTTIVQNNMPYRTLSRRVDGAFPSTIDPIALWEIKEYYYTTTFGSRVADGVYETLLDGIEINELEKACGHKIYHLLIIDDYNTWWGMGKSYLCRMIDMLHMGYVDEVIFGREVVDRLPIIAKSWAK